MKRRRDLPEYCPLCAEVSGDFKIVGNFVYGGGKEHKFYSCPACDVAFLHPQMSAAEEREFYSKEFERFMEKRAGKDFDWSGPQRHLESNRKQYLRRLIFLKGLLKKEKSVLEFGCSSGFMLLPLKEKGMKVFGIEPSNCFRGFLDEKNINIFDSLQELKRAVPKPTKFDLVMHFFILEHMRRPIEFLKQGLDLLKDGGSMVFEVPSRDDPLITIYNIPSFRKFYWSIAHNYYFNRRSLEFILRKVADKFQIFPEQRYDLSNHINWAMEGRPGGQGRYSSFFTPELDKSYLESMEKTGHCDSFIVRIRKGRKGK